MKNYQEEIEEAFLKITVSKKIMQLGINQIRFFDLQKRREQGKPLNQAEKKEYASLLFGHFMFCPNFPKNNIVKDENGEILGIPIGKAVDSTGEYIRMFLNGCEKLIPFKSLIDADFSPEEVVFIVAC